MVTTPRATKPRVIMKKQSIKKRAKKIIRTVEDKKAQPFPENEFNYGNSHLF